MSNLNTDNQSIENTINNVQESIDLTQLSSDDDNMSETNGNDNNDNDTVTEEDIKAVAEQYKNLGNEYYKDKEFNQSIIYYTHAITLQPNNVTYYNNRAAAYMALYKYNDALNDCLNAIKIDNLNIKAYQRASKCYNSNMQFNQSQTILQQCIDTYKQQKLDIPTQIEYELDEINKLQQQYNDVKELINNDDNIITQQCKDAIATIESLMSICTEAIELRILMVKYMIKLKQYNNAQTIINLVYSSNKNNVDVILLRGIVLYHLSDLLHSQQHMQECLKLDPDNKQARILLKTIKQLNNSKNEANDLFKANDYDAAIKAYTDCLVIEPTHDYYNSQIYANRAAAMMKQHNYASAVSDCSNAIRLNRMYKKAHERKIQCLLDADMLDDAYRAIETLESINVCTEDEIKQFHKKLQVERKKLKRNKINK